MTSPRLVRELGPIIDEIDFAIPANPVPPQQAPRVARMVSASGIKNCSREWFFKLSEHTRDYGREIRKPEWDLAAYYGDLIHTQIQQALFEYGLAAQAEVYLPRDGSFTSGRIDGELTTRRSLLEIKSTGQAAWAKFPHHDKFAGYQDQIQLYLERLDLPEALLVCVRREPIVEKPRAEDRGRLRQSLVKEFVITRDRAEGQRLLEKAARIREARDTGVVPAGEGIGCHFCAYQRLCLATDLEASIAETSECRS